MKKVSMFETLVFYRIRTAKLPEPVREHRFHLIRKWRFDFAWPDQKVALECEGGVWTRGRHTRGKGFNSDCEKYNAAVLEGWKVLRYTPDQINNVIPDLWKALNDI